MGFCKNVLISCSGDEVSTFGLSISPKVKITVGEIIKDVGIGDRIGEGKDNVGNFFG